MAYFRIGPSSGTSSTIYTNFTELKSETGTFSSNGVFYGKGWGDAHYDTGQGQGVGEVEATVQLYINGSLAWSWNTGYLYANSYSGTGAKGSTSTPFCTQVSKNDYWNVSYTKKTTSGSGWAGAGLQGTFFHE